MVAAPTAAAHGSSGGGDGNQAEAAAAAPVAQKPGAARKGLARLGNCFRPALLPQWGAASGPRPEVAQEDRPPHREPMPTRQRTLALARRPGCPELLLPLLGGLLLRNPSGRGLETMASRATQTRQPPGERGRPTDIAATSGCPHRESQESHGPPGAAAAPAAAAQESSGGGDGNQAEEAAAAPAAQRPGAASKGGSSSSSSRTSMGSFRAPPAGTLRPWRPVPRSPVIPDARGFLASGPPSLF